MISCRCCYVITYAINEKTWMSWFWHGLSYNIHTLKGTLLSGAKVYHNITTSSVFPSFCLCGKYLSVVWLTSHNQALKMYSMNWTENFRRHACIEWRYKHPLIDVTKPRRLLLSFENFLRQYNTVHYVRHINHTKPCIANILSFCVDHDTIKPWIE